MKTHRLHSGFRQRGSALMMALWAVIMLSAAIMIWAGYVRHTLAVAGNQQNDTDARAMAHSGVWLGLHPLVAKETPALQNWAGRDPGFRVRLVSEGSKLNINFLLTEQDPRKLEIFKRWLEYRGIDYDTRERMVDCLMDWIDQDNVKRLKGQEDVSGYHPPNRGGFQDVEEIAEVVGMEPLTMQAGWKDDLTVDSNGQIDLSSADFHILRLLPGVGDGGIQRFLQWRRGDDGIDGTLDDPQIQKMDEIQSFFGMNKTQWNALGGLIGLRDQTWRIISEGWAGNVHRQVEVVAAKGSQNPQIKRWKE